jgi:hypothetical protein
MKWTMTMQNCGMILKQLLIKFEDKRKKIILDYYIKFRKTIRSNF